MKMIMDIQCVKCHKVFKAELPSSTIGYIHEVVRCPYCNTLYHIRVNTTIIHIDITKKDLDDFEEWLLKERHILSARQYRRQVEKYLETGKLPQQLTPLNHFQDYMRIKKHRELPLW